MGGSIRVPIDTSQFGLTYRLLTPENSDDALGRTDVQWQTVLLTQHEKDSRA